MTEEHTIKCGACGESFSGATMEEAKALAMQHKEEHHS
uniref:DUF1059 domain-containing protein n=1 Tax=Promethearchaeum syntrophicum TaxID=2594042 RepID=A0A5B9DBI9_9ARCH|nr:hypothetical protein DSAG12_01939 [Candidatus Prometheoarchaeum syntrophicum]